MVDRIPDALFTQMKEKGIAYDPTLSVYEAAAAEKTGNEQLLDRSLVQQVGPADLLEGTRNMLKHQKREDLQTLTPVLRSAER